VPNTQNQLHALTGARGIAAWLVVLYHTRFAYQSQVPSSIFDFVAKGYLAVDLFFVLSGFVMWLNYADKFAAQGFAAAPDFLRRRIARIYPLYIVMLLATIGWAVMLRLVGNGPDIRFPFAELPLHFIMAQNWGLTDDLRWNVPAWSISTEFGAYLVMAAVAPAVTKIAWTPVRAASAIILLCAIESLALHAFGVQSIGGDIESTGLLRCVLAFFIGNLVCIMWQGTQSAQIRWPIVFASVAFISSMIGWANEVLIEIQAVPILFAGTVLLLAQTSTVKGNPLSSRALIYAGDISYSTYLAHFLLWIVFKQIYVTDINKVPLLMLALFLALTFAASILCYHWVEQPGRRWMQSLNLKRSAADKATV
jgi:peptidoglycan/LPS O-acetylase OafA/YrhL